MLHTRGVDDLHVPAGPGIPDGLTVPAADLSEQFSHASGPGGQGVNTSDSRVQLSLDVSATTAFSQQQRSQLLDRLDARLSSGVLTVSAAEHRSQLRNRTTARVRMAALLREALAPPPKPRRATKPSRGAHQRRLAAKRSRSEIKQNRRRPGLD